MHGEVAARIAGARATVARALRRPALVVGEVVAVALAASLAATVPQASEPEELARFAATRPAVAAVVSSLGLDRIVTSAWFLALVSLCLLSLLSVQAVQWPRVRRVWASRPEPSAFGRAPFRRELPLAAARGAPPRPLVRTSGRAAVLGSPVFHLGLLLVVTAGLGRLLWFREATGRVVEGETVAAVEAGFEAERGGWLSRPLSLSEPIRLVRVEPLRYASGTLEQLRARVVVGGGAGGVERTLAINEALEVGGIRLALHGTYGVAALVERATAAGAAPLVAWMDPRDDELRGGLRTDDGLEVRLRAGATVRPTSVEARILRGGVLLRVVDLEVGAAAPLGAGEELRLVALPAWARLHASRDPSRPLFFVGVVVGIAGVALMFGLTRVDSAVFVEGDRLVVALRPERFAALYADRFDRLCKEWEA